MSFHPNGSAALSAALAISKIVDERLALPVAIRKEVPGGVLKGRATLPEGQAS
jgi:hypothetical protein